MTASRKLKDLRSAGWQFVAFGILAPNVFATVGILVAHAYSCLTGIRSSWALMCCSPFFAGRPRTSPCPRFSGWPFRKRAQRCLWRPPGADVLLQRDDRHSPLHGDCQGSHPQFSGGLIAVCRARKGPPDLLEAMPSGGGLTSSRRLNDHRKERATGFRLTRQAVVRGPAGTIAQAMPPARQGGRHEEDHRGRPNHFRSTSLRKTRTFFWFWLMARALVILLSPAPIPVSFRT